MHQPFEEPVFVTRPLMPDYDEYTQRLKEVWDSRWLSNNGEQHRRLEEQIKAFLHSPYLSLFNNGTTALTIAVQALRLQGEVITTPFTFPATTHSLTWNNITPVFCDVDDETLTLDVDQLESLINNRTTAILGVHVYGVPCHVEEIQRLADIHGLKVIYDAAHAFGTEINGKPIAQFGDVSMFSFHPTKLFHTAEGGALTCNSEHTKAQFDLLKNFGIKNEVEVVMPGINGKMNELSAVMGQCVLPLVEAEMAERAKIRAIYSTSFDEVDGITICEVGENIRNSEQYMVIRIDEDVFGVSRDVVYDYLRQFNVMARKYFFPLTSDYPFYRHLASSNQPLQVAKRASTEVLCLPLFGDLDHKTVEMICELVIESVQSVR